MYSKQYVGGYILFPRVLCEGALWENRDAFRLYLYYLQKARYGSDNETLTDWTVRRGELVTSCQRISDETAWKHNNKMKFYNRGRIKQLNDFLEDNGLITVTANINGTKIRILHYSSLQDIKSYMNNNPEIHTSNSKRTYKKEVNSDNELFIKEVCPKSDDFSPNSSKNKSLIASEMKDVLAIENDTDNGLPSNDDKVYPIHPESDHSRQITSHESKDMPKSKTTVTNKVFNEDSEEIKLSKLLFTFIQERDSKARVPNFQKWAPHIELLYRKDNRSYEEIEDIIRWCQNNTFWRSSILSTSKLRNKFEQLYQQKLGEHHYGKHNPIQQNTFDQRGSEYSYDF